MRLDGRNAIITGAASGIGRAAANRFAAEGARLLLIDRADAVNETAAGIVASGGVAEAVVADTSTEPPLRDAVAHMVARYGRLDACFANAGISGEALDIDAITAAHWQQVLGVNLIGTFLLIKHAARIMRAQGAGSIICTASVAGLRSGAGPIPYSASKAAVINLVQTSANALHGSGVRVNAICPGLIETGMTQATFEAARARGKSHKLGQLNPLRRAGEAREIADAALFLASDESSYINGQALVVDGGLSSSLPIVPKREPAP